MSTAPRNRRGPKGAEIIKRENAELKAELAVLRPQILKRECDYENRREALHNEQMQMLVAELSASRIALVKSRGEAKRCQDEASKGSAQLASERMAFEGSLLDAREAAQKELNIAVAAKVRMIASRDAKLVEALRLRKADQQHSQELEEEASAGALEVHFSAYRYIDAVESFVAAEDSSE